MRGEPCTLEAPKGSILFRETVSFGGVSSFLLHEKVIRKLMTNHSIIRIDLGVFLYIINYIFDNEFAPTIWV